MVKSKVTRLDPLGVRRVMDVGGPPPLRKLTNLPDPKLAKKNPQANHPLYQLSLNPHDDPVGVSGLTFLHQKVQARNLHLYGKVILPLPLRFNLLNLLRSGTTQSPLLLPLLEFRTSLWLLTYTVRKMERKR
jgi:hypothetical protein